MGDYGYGIWVLASVAVIFLAVRKRWGLGWDYFERNPTTVGEAALDWLVWIVPVLFFVVVVNNALVWLGMATEWQMVLWVAFIAYAIARSIDYYKIVRDLRGTIATEEEMREGVSVEEILRAAQQGKGQG